MYRTLLAISLALLTPLASARSDATDAAAQEGASQLTAEEGFAAAVSRLDRRAGLIETYLDPEGGRVLVALPAPDERGVSGRYIYQAYLRRGVGSNPLGLDRSYGGASQLVAFRRAGKRVLVEAENWRFQARGGSAAETRAVQESFAGSVLWATDVLATDGDGRLLVDLSGFLLRDAVGVGARVKAGGQGSVTLDPGRSVVEVGDALVFPDNLELEGTLTFAGEEPGGELRATTPEPGALSVVQHHSLVRLPEPGFSMRPADPRIGAIDHLVHDYAAPLAEPLVTRFVRRHRLQKTDPTVARSPVVEPIVYYLDRGAPEPIRSALLDGARWWAEAFEAAGFEDAYRVELLPEDAHPLDARYNVITWVHRATRGWSYGASVTDPRTGEIVKGFVLLGSQRVRQDRLIFEGLAGRAATGTGAPDDPLELALARIRQLAAHEVGHTLGLQHNFAASAAGRASVMDYPAPWVRVDGEGALDFSASYGVGLGPWDRFTIAWMYRQFPPGVAEGDALEGMIREASRAERLFVTDAHGRGVGTAHPHAAVWDNGADPVAALREAMAVRRIALADFGDDRLAPGRPAGQLRRVLVPIYLYHRYQVAAAAKLVAGADYAYRVAGDGGPPVRPVPAERQWEALDALLATVQPEALDLPDTVLDRLTPVSRGFSSDPVTDRELFDGATDPLFDLPAAAGSAARLPLRALLHPARLARLAEQHRRDPALPGLDGVLDRLLAAVFPPPETDSRRAAGLRRLVQRETIEALVGVAGRGDVASAVAHTVESRLRELRRTLDHEAPAGAQQRHERQLAARLARFLDRSATAGPAPRAPEPPPGSPIGAGILPGFGTRAVDCWHCEGAGR